jgi:hypothetical protein
VDSKRRKTVEYFLIPAIFLATIVFVLDSIAYPATP